MFGQVARELNRFWRRTFGRREWLKTKDADLKRDLLAEKLVQLLDVAKNNNVDFDDMTIFCTYTSEGFYVGEYSGAGVEDAIATVRVRDLPVVKQSLLSLRSNDPQTTQTVNAALDALVGEVFRQVYGKNLLAGAR
jgi:hypothetical protein